MFKYSYIDKIEHKSDNINIENYNDIIYLDCSKHRLKSLPILPNSLIKFNYAYNKLWIHKI